MKNNKLLSAKEKEKGDGGGLVREGNTEALCERSFSETCVEKIKSVHNQTVMLRLYTTHTQKKKTLKKGDLSGLKVYRREPEQRETLIDMSAAQGNLFLSDSGKNRRGIIEPSNPSKELSFFSFFFNAARPHCPAALLHSATQSTLSLICHVFFSPFFFPGKKGEGWVCDYAFL